MATDRFAMFRLTTVFVRRHPPTEWLESAIERTREALEQRIERSDRDNRVRFAALEAAVQRIDLES